jgi:outer membrane immunogenic protein
MSRNLFLSAALLIGFSGSAFAADLPSRAAPPVYLPPPPVFSWTGVYIGGQIGYQWGTSSTTALTAVGPQSQASYSPNGVVGGAHIGYNYQIAQFVLGLEGDVNGSGYQGSGFNNAGIVQHSTREDIQGSIRGRVGAAWDRALIYATGGVAIGSLHNSYLNTSDGRSDTFDTTRVGWTVGGGVEYAITNNWSLRAEYRYTDYGHYNDFLANSTAGTVTARKHETDNMVTAGFSYKFDMFAPPGPVVAKY